MIMRLSESYSMSVNFDFMMIGEIEAYKVRRGNCSTGAKRMGRSLGGVRIR